MRFIVWYYSYAISCCPMDTMRAANHIRADKDSVYFYLMDIGYRGFHIEKVWNCYHYQDPNPYYRSNRITCFMFAVRKDLSALIHVSPTFTSIYLRNSLNQSIHILLSGNYSHTKQKLKKDEKYKKKFLGNNGYLGKGLLE